MLGAVSADLTLIAMYDFSAGRRGRHRRRDRAVAEPGTGGWMACGAFLLLGRRRLRGRPPARGLRCPTGRTAPTRAVLGHPGPRLRPLPAAAKVVLFVVLAACAVLPADGHGVLAEGAGLRDRHLRAAGHRPQRRRRLGRSARPRVHRLLRDRVLHHGLPHRRAAASSRRTGCTSPRCWRSRSRSSICLIAGVALGAPTLRLRGDYLAIVTLGFGEIIRIVAVNNPATSPTGPRAPSASRTRGSTSARSQFTWGQNQLQYWYLLLVLIVIVVLLFRRLEASRLGRAWAAIREDEVAAQATGINTTRVKLLAFAIGASTSGVAGVFFASQIGYINPDNFVLNNSILVVAYVVFGGMGSLPGAMAGAAVLTWLPEFLKDQVPAEDRQMWIGAVILLMMIFRPAGLIPARRRAAELHGFDDDSADETRAVPAGEGMGARS